MQEAEITPGIAQVLEKTIRDARQLVSAEIAVAKAEAGEQLRSLALSGLFLAGGVMFLQAAITSLGVVLVLVLRGTGLRFAIVGGLVALALMFGIIGVRAMKLHGIRSAARLKVDVRKLTEAVK